MQNLKTNLTAISKLLLAVVFVAMKYKQGQQLGETDYALLYLAVTGALGNFFSADAIKQAVGLASTPEAAPVAVTESVQAPKTSKRPRAR